MKAKSRIKQFSDNMAANYGMVWDVVIGAVSALLAAIVFVGLYAAAMKLFHISENSIPVVDQVGKMLCILLGAFMAVRHHPVKGWLRGGLAGVLYVLLAFVLFSAIDGDWSFDWTLLADVLMGFAVGAIGGVLLVNLRRKKS